MTQGIPDPRPQRRWLYHVAPGWAHDSTYFITICCAARGQNQLCIPAISEPLLQAAAHYHRQLRWYVHLWLLMPDHVSCPRSEDLATIIAAWKRHAARSCGIAWQKGFFDHRLRDDENFEEKASYIRMNPVRKGLVTQPEDWPHVWPKV